MSSGRFSLIRILKFSGVIALLLAAILVADYRYGFRRTPKVLTKQKGTEHFYIYTDLDGASLLYYERFFEGFYEYFNSEYFEIGQSRPLKVYLFSGIDSYGPYLQSVRGVRTPYGFYMGPWANIIVVNCESGLGTTTHELVHHFIRTSFARRPDKWVEEGIATFFEKFIGHFGEQGKLDISFGYFSNWRFPETKKNAKWLSIETMIIMEEPDQSAARSLMLFLYKKGLFKSFVREMSVEKNDPTGVAVLEKVCGKSVAEIEREWKDWVVSQPIDGDVMLVPKAFVLEERDWQNWWNSNQSRLYWSEAEQIYRAKQ